MRESAVPLGAEKGLAHLCSASAALFGRGSRCVLLPLGCRPRAGFVMAKSLLRVHECLLLLTSDISKGAAGPAFFQLIPHPRLRGMQPRWLSSPAKLRF